MRTERDKFLTEAMGILLCPPYCGCTDCCTGQSVHAPVDFSTWDGFGKLWEWAQKQGWWGDFKIYAIENDLYVDDLINPNRFADAVYEFLKSPK